jgi:hypothetical protein
MPISKKSLKALAKKLGIDEAKVNAAIDSTEDVDIDIPDVKVFKPEDGAQVFTADELKVRDSSKYNEGKTAGVETEIKEYKKTNSLDFKGKTLKDLADHIASSTDKDGTVKTLRENLTAAEKEKNEAISALSKVNTRNKIHALIPELTNGMSKAEAEAVLVANGFEFEDVSGKIGHKRNGSPTKDPKTLEEIPTEVAVKNFFEGEKKWTGAAAGDDTRGGRGGGNSDTKTKPAYKKASEVQKAFDEKHGAGASMGTEFDYAGHLQKVMKEPDEAGTPLVMD